MNLILKVLTCVCISLLNIYIQPIQGNLDDLQTEFNWLSQETQDFILTASNRKENINESPAITIIITKDDLKERGYTDLNFILDDLPGFHTSRPQGDTYFKTYLRGFRNNTGTPFILLVDGQYMNDFYYNSAEILKTIPISNIERIEMVYGPASSLYGANALMGVLNIITNKNKSNKNKTQITMTSISRNATPGNLQKVVDFSLQSKEAPIQYSITARGHFGIEDPTNHNQYEYMNPSYFFDPNIWGGVLNVDEYIGNESGVRNLAVDSRVFSGDFEAGVLYYRNDQGYGLEYAGNALQANATWVEQERNFFIKHTTSIDNTMLKNLSVSHLFRYRNSDVIGSSMEFYNWQGYVGFDYFQALNNSLSFKSTSDFSLSDYLDISTGVSYEFKDLSKAYELTSYYASSLDPDSFDAENIPEPVSTQRQAENRQYLEETSAFFLSKYKLNKNSSINKFSILNIGARIDDNSVYGDHVTVRTSLVKNFYNWNFKMLYGNAIQTPSNRLVYGGWGPNQSSPDVAPEKATTIEGSIGYKHKISNYILSVYQVNITDKMINNALGAFNVGTGEIFGIDIHSSHTKEVNNSKSWIEKIKLTSYLSYITGKEDIIEVIDDELVNTGRDSIGDLAPIRLRGAITSYMKSSIASSLFSTVAFRYVSETDNYYTNPIETTDSYTVFDLILGANNIFVDGLNLNLTITNLFNTIYYHPGIKSADAGDTPTTSEVTEDDITYTIYDNVLNGEVYNSLLPQPGRLYNIALTWNF